MAVYAALSAFGQAKGDGPSDTESKLAWRSDMMSRQTGQRQERPTSGRDGGEAQAARTFKSRCAFAMRKLRKDAPSAAERGQRGMTMLLRAVAENSIDQAPTPAPPIHYSMASDTEGSVTDEPVCVSDRLRELEMRLMDYEEKMINLTTLICRSPVPACGMSAPPGLTTAEGMNESGLDAVRDTQSGLIGAVSSVEPGGGGSPAMALCPAHKDGNPDLIKSVASALCSVQAAQMDAMPPESDEVSTPSGLMELPTAQRTKGDICPISASVLHSAQHAQTAATYSEADDSSGPSGTSVGVQPQVAKDSIISTQMDDNSIGIGTIASGKRGDQDEQIAAVAVATDADSGPAVVRSAALAMAQTAEGAVGPTQIDDSPVVIDSIGSAIRNAHLVQTEASSIESACGSGPTAATAEAPAMAPVTEGPASRARQKLILMEAMEHLCQELATSIDGCADGEVLSNDLRAKFRIVAKASEHGHLAERQAARNLLDGKCPTKAATRAALLGWISNEKRLRRLYACMQMHQPVDTTREKVVRCKVGGIIGAVGKKPHLLLALMSGLEQAQPWSNALASMIVDMEKCMARGTGNQPV